jgi:hypothetical protein
MSGSKTINAEFIGKIKTLGTKIVSYLNLQICFLRLPLYQIKPQPFR